MDVSTAAPPTLRQALKVWLLIGLNSFGGPAGQISLMHRMLVEERGWIDENSFLHALNFCMLLPGPEAMQLATYIGWRLHGTLGGLIAGVLFVLPGFLAIAGLSVLYVTLGDLALVEAVFFGLKAAVLAVVIVALQRLASRVLDQALRWLLAGLAFVSLFAFNVPFPLVVLGAGLFGLLATRNRWLTDSNPDAPPVASIAWQTTLRTGFVWLALWLIPIVMIGWLFGRDSVFVQQMLFFSKTAMVTFGGAYAVLAYVAQQAVEAFAWLQPGEMLDGLGMAEATPGPLIQILQFVGFMGAWRAETGLTPISAALLASVLVTWVTFVPCFLWIFVGAPYMEQLRGNRWLSGALSCITAAVAGVMLNLAVWFGLHLLFDELTERQMGPLRVLVPDLGSLNGLSLAITVAAWLVLWRSKLGVIPVLAIAASTGAVLSLLIG